MAQQSQYVVIADALNVHAAPSLHGKVVSVVSKGTIVDKLEVSGEGYWHRIQHTGGTGWVSHKYLEPVAGTVPQSNFPWFAIAYAEMGVREVSGSGDDLRIAEYLRSTTLKAPESSNDETPWCSAFVNWCVERAGYAATDSAWARSWLQWGRPTDTPVVGAITVFERNLTSGHVAFFVSRLGSSITVLGGNQPDAVSIADYPAGRLLGYRIPT